MKPANTQLKVLLLGANLLTPEQFEKAEKAAKEKKHPLGIELVQSGAIKDQQLGQVIANYLKLNFLDLASQPIASNLLTLVPEPVARAQQTIPIKEKDGKLIIATANPGNHDFFKLLEKKVGKALEITYATPLGIQNALIAYKSDLSEKIKKLLADFEAHPENEDDIVKLVNVMLEYAHDNRSSDIHIEPLEEEVSVRFRIDGVLHEVARYPKKLHEKIVFRIKIMAKLKTDEHAAVQDGRLSYDPKSEEGKKETVDVRLSILPITQGENLVMRLLGTTQERILLGDLGLTQADRETVERAAKNSYGMILTVGPTGSGKTTSLYAVLQTLNKPEVNIMTIEDPVEYTMPHVQQAQVNLKKELTFANGLRAIVRQDPDIVMVGEIRDEETADIAVNAAMTGHLVLSTLHANNAATTFPRLLEMGVEPFLVASSIKIIVAQRLIRKICTRCRTSYALGNKVEKLQTEPEFLEDLKKISGKENCKSLRCYKGTGCIACNNSGYDGREAIFEVLEVTEEIQKLITEKASSEDIQKLAKANGMKSLMEAGIEKVIQGITGIEEVLRVTKN